MRVEPGHNEGDNVVHLTRTLLGERALCGEQVTMIGTPTISDRSKIEACPECCRIAEEGGADLTESIWMRALANLAGKRARP